MKKDVNDAVRRYGWAPLEVHFREPYDYGTGPKTQAGEYGKIIPGWVCLIAAANGVDKDLDLVYIPSDAVAYVTSVEPIGKPQI